MDIPEDLPSDWRDSSPAKYLGVVRLRSNVDLDKIGPYVDLGRLFLGHLRDRLSTGGTPNGKYVRALPDGTIITVSFDGTVNHIQVEVPPPPPGEPSLDWRPVFLFYEKAFYSDPWRYGYWYDADDQRHDRPIPYLIGEPEVFPEDWPREITRSITEIPYRQRDLEYDIVEGKNPRYGNQYLFVKGPPPAVYSWWGSPFGDMPHLWFKSKAALIASNQRYMPAYCDFEQQYLYATELPELTRGPPLTVYKNGADLFVCPGEPSYALIAGVGVARNGDVLVVLASHKSMSLVYWTQSGSPEPGGLLLSDGDEVAAHPFRFNEDATKGAVIAKLPGDDGKETLCVVEFTIHYNEQTRSYLATESKRTPFAGTYSTLIEAQNTYSTVSSAPSADRGTVIPGGTALTITDAQDSVSTSIKDIEWPIGLAYKNNTLVIATLKRIETTTNTFHWADNEFSSTVAWNHLPPFGDLFPFNSESRTINIFTHESQKTSCYEVKTTLNIKGKRWVIEDLSRTYHYHYDNPDNNGTELIYSSVELTKCDGTPPDLPINAANWIKTSTSWTRNDVSSEDSDITIGYNAQLGYLSVADRVLMFWRTDYDVTDIRTFLKYWTNPTRSIQTMTHYPCLEEASTVISQCDLQSAITETDIQRDYSLSQLILIKPPSIEPMKVGKEIILKDSEVLGPWNGSGSVGVHDAVTSPDTPDCFSSQSYADYQAIINRVVQFPTPAWAAGVGSAIGHTPFSTSYNFSDLIAAHTAATLTQDYCNRYFKGASSLTSDASLEFSGSIRSRLQPSLPISEWIYAANAAGYFVDPTYTWTPFGIYDAGGIFVKRFDSALDGLPGDLGIPDPTVYPIGWTIQPLQDDD